tara:strand:- start:51371 stop:52072 length:702 start_codon:yes stop_codon:yes gene_type:complete
MDRNDFFKIIYWLAVSFLIALLLQNSIPSFWNAWPIALFLLPAALMVKYGINTAKNFKGFSKWLRYFFIAILSLYWGYIAITIAYWCFLELKADSLEKILINPIFIWMIIGFFVLLEHAFFKTHNKTKNETIIIYSDRKKTVIKINNLAYIESRGNFTLAILEDGSSYKNNIRISEWESRLKGFVRIHRSFLVNPKCATLQGNEVVVNAKWSLPISRTYKEKVIDYFENMPNP